jgi:hypothetical protein
MIPVPLTILGRAIGVKTSVETANKVFCSLAADASSLRCSPIRDTGFSESHPYSRTEQCYSLPSQPGSNMLNRTGW